VPSAASDAIAEKSLVNDEAVIIGVGPGAVVIVGVVVLVVEDDELPQPATPSPRTTIADAGSSTPRGTENFMFPPPLLWLRPTGLGELTLAKDEASLPSTGIPRMGRKHAPTTQEIRTDM
jgi:hypothetical protein